MWSVPMNGLFRTVLEEERGVDPSRHTENEIQRPQNLLTGPQFFGGLRCLMEVDKPLLMALRIQIGAYVVSVICDIRVIVCNNALAQSARMRSANHGNAVDHE